MYVVPNMIRSMRFAGGQLVEVDIDEQQMQSLFYATNADAKRELSQAYDELAKSRRQCASLAEQLGAIKERLATENSKPRKFSLRRRQD